MSHHDAWAQAIHQYEEQQRQARAAREQSVTEQQNRKKQQEEELHITREMERRVTEQRQSELRMLAQQRVAEQQRRKEEQRIAMLARSSEALRIAEQQRREAQLAVTLKRQEEQKTKQAGSPIEITFKDAWCIAHPSIELTPQYRIGRFRVDFAHLPTKTVIELDGHPTHHTRRDRTRDYQRQRWIEEEGWSFIRFTGTEIFNDVESCVQIVWRRIEKSETHDHS